jgi:hypothetical protein
MAVIVKSSRIQPAVIGVTAFYNEEITETSTTSNTVYSLKLSLVTPSTLPLGNYILQYQFIWRSSNAAREADFQIRQNSTQIEQWEPSTGRVQDRQLLSGFELIENISGVQTFDLRFKRQASTGGTTIFVKDAKMFLTRVL